jgi:hypothetical protein
VAKKPHWPIQRVKSLVAAEKFWVQKTKALDFIGGTLTEARAEVATVIGALTEAAFAHSQDLTWNKADVYGVSFRGGGWYLKLTIDEEEHERDARQGDRGEVAIISMHPLERALRTNRGEVKP